jgi:hypothetical protein
MVELQIVVLVVAGSSPVGHPILFFRLPLKLVNYRAGRDLLNFVANLTSAKRLCLGQALMENVKKPTEGA